MKLYDTLTGTKKEFIPLRDVVTMYVCGPNLYGPCHVGHALSYVFFDILRRYLEYSGHRVIQVQNFTDIEDRIIEVAQTEGRGIEDLASQYIQRFLEEMDGLGIQRATHYPKATDYLERMIDIISDLIQKGHAYVVEGDVYFRVRTFKDYGSLSRRSVDDVKSGTRIEEDPRKEDQMDFALWKASKEGEPSWPTPWGSGRPGWHIECTAMSLSLLGNQIDIHGGGQDVIFPHHENEIAQSEVFTGMSPFVQFWVHNGLLRLSDNDEEKMTRHRGNIVSCRDALSEYTADTLRLYFASSHYRSPLTYSEEGLRSARRALGRLLNTLRLLPDNQGNGQEIDVQTHQERFFVAMEDDLNTPQALAAIFDLARDINRHKEQGGLVAYGQQSLREMAAILGLSLNEDHDSDIKDAYPFVDILVDTRNRLRSERNWDLADQIRSQLEALGVAIEDTANGTQWRFI